MNRDGAKIVVKRNIFSRKKIFFYLFIFLSITSVRSLEVNFRHLGNDLEGINRSMRREVVSLNMIHVDSTALHIQSLNNIQHVVLKILKFTNALLGTLEVDDVDSVETNEGLDETNISESDAVTSEVAPLAEEFVDFFETLEENFISFVVSFLGAGETTFVDTIVDTFVSPFVDAIDFFL